MKGFVDRTQHFWTYFIEFIMCGFSGWAYEMIAGYIVDGHMVNRGFIHLPVCIIYGIFSMAVLAIFKREKHRPAAVFFLSIIIVTAMEYLSSVIIETALHRRLWDYSRWIFNLNGRVSLISSLIFGTGCVLLVFWIHPAVSAFLNKKCRAEVPFGLGTVLLISVGADYLITFLNR